MKRIISIVFVFFLSWASVSGGACLNAGPSATESYIQMYAPLAVRLGRTGILPSIALAQGIFESASGTSKLAVGGNNHFGVKCKDSCKIPSHCVRSFDDGRWCRFRAYDSVKESYLAHNSMLRRGRYSDLRCLGRNYEAWALALQCKGYATDKGYAKKLILIIKKYRLYEYDDAWLQQGFDPSGRYCNLPGWFRGGR